MDRNNLKDLSEEELKIVELLSNLPTDDSRLNVFGCFCVHCGEYTPYSYCYCSHDD
jgi:hypothetical protein